MGVDTKEHNVSLSNNIRILRGHISVREEGEIRPPISPNKTLMIYFQTVPVSYC